jgi:hypothetical protein
VSPAGGSVAVRENENRLGSCRVYSVTQWPDATLISAPLPIAGFFPYQLKKLLLGDDWDAESAGSF